MEYFNNLPIYEITINDESDGVFMMSIVDTPAVDHNFLKFNKHKEKVIYHFNDEKRIITGVALRANYPILRFEDGKYFYVRFSPEEIEKMAYKFMREKKLDNVNINHSQNEGDIFLIESYILDSKHNIQEFKDVELGSWIVSYKVENDEVWEAIKKGHLNGFSVELTANLELAMKKDLEELKTIYELINILEKV